MRIWGPEGQDLKVRTSSSHLLSLTFHVRQSPSCSERGSHHSNGERWRYIVCVWTEHSVKTRSADPDSLIQLNNMLCFYEEDQWVWTQAGFCTRIMCVCIYISLNSTLNINNKRGADLCLCWCSTVFGDPIKPVHSLVLGGSGNQGKNICLSHCLFLCLLDSTC